MAQTRYLPARAPAFPTGCTMRCKWLVMHVPRRPLFVLTWGCGRIQPGQAADDLVEKFIHHQVSVQHLRCLLEALGLCVVVRVAAAAYRSEEAEFGENASMQPRRMLRSGSVWNTQPGKGRRSAIALRSAFTARQASMLRPMAQPTTRRDQASSISVA